MPPPDRSSEKTAPKPNTARPPRTGPSPTGRRTSTTPTRRGRRTRSRSGTSCAPRVLSRTPTATGARGCRSPTTVVAEVAYDTEHFTSRSIIVTESPTGSTPAPVGIAPPITSDPPFHHGARRLLLPEFAPKAIAALEEYTRAYCNSLLDAIEGQDVVDAAIDFGQHIPVRVIAKMLGFPAEDADKFRQFVYDVLERVDRPRAERSDHDRPPDRVHRRQMEDHIENPRDDLTSTC